MKIRRRHVFIYVVLITLICLVIVTLSFDKYARNESINHNNRPIIEKYLSDQDKKFLIDNTIDVALFIDYIKEPDFNIKNYEYYQLIGEANPKMSAEDVVKKTNSLIENNFTLKYLRNVLKNHIYEVDDLLELAQLGLNNVDKIAEFNPNNKLALANATYYISKYKPKDLVKVNAQLSNKKTIYVTNETNQQLDLLCQKLEMLNGKKCGGLQVQYGYISYEQASQVKDAGYPLVPGYNTFQLGTTIMFKNDATFIKSEMYLWLLENANKFGFILRFPQGKEAVTGVNYQPLTFTYVGVDNAQAIYQGQQTLEEKRGA